MAIFFSTVCKKIRKSYGSVTTYRMGGQNILRDKVTQVRNPKTLLQQMQRRRHATLVELSGVFCQATPLGFPQRPLKQSPHNQFVQLNSGTVQVSNELLVTVDYSGILVAKGNRELPEVMATLDEESSKLSVMWVQEDFVWHAADDDQLYAVLLEKELKQAKVFLLGERKDTEPSKITLPSAWKPDQVALYVFILSKNRKNASTSKYVTIS